jgi:hypothetical protein
MWLKRPRLAGAGTAFTVLGLLLSSSAGARVEGDSEYTKAQTYSAALRYLRVDLGYEVVERDPEAAYLIFRYQLPGQPKNATSATLEVIEAAGHVKLFVQIPRMPEYHERILRDGLLKKLRDEYGVPAKKQPPPEKKPPSDAGSE